MLWRRYLERGTLKALLVNRNSAKEIATAFADWRSQFRRYQLCYAFCEGLNLLSLVASATITNLLLRRKFFAYGPEASGVEKFTPK